MATNLLRSLGNRARTIYRATFIGASAAKQIHDNRKHKKAAAAQQASAARSRQVKQRVAGVNRVTRSVTYGNRKQRAKQLRSMRNNPAQRATLKRRVKFYTLP